MKSESMNFGADSGTPAEQNEHAAQKWQAALEGVDQLGDRLGLGVDEGIKETVAAFHVMDINTTASHEGKLDRHPIPYIDVESAEAQVLNDELRTIKDESAKEAIHEKILRSNLAERRKLIPLLEEFYTDRKVPYEVRLGITSYARGWSRVENQGADFQEIEEDESVKKARLEQFQEEMHAFTEFLKTKFFTRSVPPEGIEPSLED